MKKRISAAVVGMVGLVAASSAWVGAGAMLLSGSSALAQQSEARDTIEFTSGKVLECTIVEETDREVRAIVYMGTIKSEMTYQKSEIAKITRGATPAPGTPPTPAPRTGGTPVIPSSTATEPTRVYVMNLTGKFGFDISQTPMRQAMKDAKSHRPDIVIVKLDNEWMLNEFEKAPDDAAAFDQLWRAEDMDDILTNELQAEWEKPPKVVFWVKNAMGGASFLPLVVPDIYFHSQGKMGGIGNLTLMFQGVGDAVVREKQYSLRLGHAEGMAIRGGHSVEIVRAMAAYEYELAVSFDGDMPVYHPGRVARAGSGEYTLTDNGMNENLDTLEARVQGTGNDVLTLNAEWAYKLKLSKGTADTLPELLTLMGIEHHHTIVQGRSDRIMDAWSQGVGSAGRQLRRMWSEYNDIAIRGDYNERTRARGQRIRKIDEMLSLIRKFEEAVNPEREGVPSSATLEIIKDQLKLQQLQDRR